MRYNFQKSVIHAVSNDTTIVASNRFALATQGRQPEDENAIGGRGGGRADIEGWALHW